MGASAGRDGGKPPGEPGGRSFVVQRHTVGHGEVHYDLMIEDGDVLVTFQLDAPPAPGVRGRRSFDHRRRYLSYEGELSGGRGSVAIYDRGQVEDLEGGPRQARYRLRFSGETLHGELWLVSDEDVVELRA